jgi:hypothetical protein
VAHVTEFTVEGLAGRTHPLSEKLDRHTNVFFGLNGSGKTSLLKILHSAMSGNANSLLQVPFTRAEVKIYSVNNNEVFTRICVKKTHADADVVDEPARLAATIRSAASAVVASESKELKLIGVKIRLRRPQPRRVGPTAIYQRPVFILEIRSSTALHNIRGRCPVT